MTPDGLQSAFDQALSALLGPKVPRVLGLAVSGGGDSMAMLMLADAWAADNGVALYVLTVDHGLRPEAAGEAQMVAETCARLGHSHAVATWQWDGQGNVQSRARDARLGLIDQWRGRIAHVLMAHTKDDLAETFLMRMQRGSGVQGLAAMRADRVVAPQPYVPGGISGDVPPKRDVGGKATLGRGSFRLLRPCLGMRRNALRDLLRAREVGWADDPSNEDPTFERVRMRQMLSQWEAAGMGVETLADTAQRLARARPALDQRACDVWRQLGQMDQTTGDILLSPKLCQVEPETGLRLLAAALRFVASAPYAPRETALQSLWNQLAEGRGGTLHGCELLQDKAGIRVFREYKAVENVQGAAAYGQSWDHRWIVNTSDYNGLTLRALGEDGWTQIKSPPPGHPPYKSARSLPSLWDGGKLTWCAAMGLGKVNQVMLRPMQMTTLSFTDFLISH